MVTRRGWLLVGAAVALLVCGRILGIAELYGLAVAAAMVVVGARVLVARGPGELVVSARVSPPVAYIGEAARLELHVENRGARVSRGALLRPTPYRGNQTPVRLGEIAVPPLVPGESARVIAALPTTRRGAYEVSGVFIDLEDPLGLACRRTSTPCEARFVVLPVLEQLEDIAPFSAFAGRDEALRSTARRLGSGLSSFRRYDEGDDLRLVHWKTTARIGELMVREGGDPEAPESLSVTVVLDCRRSPHTPESLETAVSAAASVIDTCGSIGAAVRLVTTGGVDTGFGDDEEHQEAALVELAVVETRSETMSRSVRGESDGDDGSGLLVAVTTTRAIDRDIETLLLARRARTPVLVLVRESGERPSTDLGAECVTVRAGASVRAAWMEAFGTPEVDDAEPARLAATAERMAAASSEKGASS